MGIPTKQSDSATIGCPLSALLLPKNQAILKTTLFELSALLCAAGSNFYFLNPNSGDEAPALHAFLSPDPLPVLQIPARMALQKGTLLHYVPASHKSHGVEGGPPFEVLCAPLHMNGNAGAVFCFHKDAGKEAGGFFESDLNLLRNFVASFALMLGESVCKDGDLLWIKFQTSLLALIENAQLQQSVLDFQHRLDSILEVSNVINSSKQLDEMIEAILLSCRKVMRAKSASMFLVEKETGDLLFTVVSNKAEKDLMGFRVPRGQGIVGICAEEKRTIVVSDAQNDPRVYKGVDESASYVTHNLIAAPLLVSGDCIGVVEVLNKIDKAEFGKSDVELFASFADSIAIAVQRRILLDELQSSNKKLEHRLRETRTLHAVTESMIEEGSAEEMFKRVIHVLKNNLNVGSFSVLLYKPQKNTFKLLSTLREKSSLELDLEQSPLAHRVFERNEAIFLNNICEDPVLSELANPNRYKSLSCILIPLSAGKNQKPVGVLCSTDPESGKFHEKDFQLLKTISMQLLRGYQNIQMKEEVLSKQRLEKELEITSRIQKNILPKPPKSHPHLEISARSVMAKTTGGDFYDYFLHSENGPASFLVADVSGKSLPAALFMAVSSSILRTVIRMELEPEAVLNKANDLLYEESESGMFVTTFLAHYEPGHSKLNFASGGHNEMLLLHKDGGHEILSAKGHPLGVLPSYLQKYRRGEVAIQHEDILVLYTDGVVEATNRQNQEYGFERFIKILQDHKEKSTEEIIEAVYRDVERHSEEQEMFDDFTMLVVRFLPLPQEKQSYHISLPATKGSIPRLREFIKKHCIVHGMYGNVLDDILLAADEAATNIILHAYADKEKAGEPDFECDLQIKTRKFIRLVFKDKGRPFELDSVSEPDISKNLAGKRRGGFGVFLIRSLTNKMSYERIGETNFLTIEREL